MRRPKHTFSLFSALLLGATLLGCQAEGTGTPERSGEPDVGAAVEQAASPKADLTLAGYFFDRQASRILGSVMNTAGEGFVNVQVTFNLFDARGRKIGTARDSTSEVGPGGVWTFGISVAQRGSVSRAEKASVTGTARSLIRQREALTDSASQGLAGTPPPGEVPSGNPAL